MRQFHDYKTFVVRSALGVVEKAPEMINLISYSEFLSSCNKLQISKKDTIWWPALSLFGQLDNDNYTPNNDILNQFFN